MSRSCGAECQRGGFLAVPATNGLGAEAGPPRVTALPATSAAVELQACIAKLEEDVRIAQEALTCARSQNDALYTEMAERDTLWSARARAADAQAETLQRSLAEAWSA